MKDADELSQGEGARGSPVSLEEVLTQLETEHELVLRKEIPRLQKLLRTADAAEGSRFGGVFRALNEELARLWFEVEQHLQKEEDVLFPFVRELERNPEQAGRGSGTDVGDLEGLSQEHQSASERVERIRRLAGNYALPAGAGPALGKLYAALQAMEDALRNHMNVEDGVLIPRAMALAQRLRRD